LIVNRVTDVHSLLPRQLQPQKSFRRYQRRTANSNLAFTDTLIYPTTWFELGSFAGRRYSYLFHCAWFQNCFILAADMVKANANAAPAATAPGVYSAVYSGIPVYEFQFGAELKEHVMRRRSDNWINATHILKAAGFDKPARTRILERDVQKDVHEKIQGGYGKYQGTWIPLESGQALAERHSVIDRLRPIFEYTQGAESPPPAPRHASKPKGPKSRPPLPKWNSTSNSNRSMALKLTPFRSASSTSCSSARDSRRWRYPDG
jgi:hypothetical protein